jgi:predicted dehydrogenase
MMRAAIVGTGGIAKVHARLIHELGGTVVGVCGRTLGAAAAFGAGVPYDNLVRLLAEQKPDVVHVCTPNHLHAEQSIAAFAAGAHVLCEKPMAISREECLRMIEAADRAGRVGGIAYCYRGYPLIEVIRARVLAGNFGALRRIGGCYLSQDVLDPAKYVWHFTPGSVGPAFALMDYGVHWSTSPNT